MKQKILIALSAVGPGLFLIGYNIGTGSITTMAKAGANYGMSLFWALVLSAIFTYVLMVAYGQVTLVTGRTALYNIRKNFLFGSVLSVYILVALVIGELLAIMGVMGIVVDLIIEGIRLMGWGIADAFWITLVLVISLFILLWYGKYKIFEKILTFFVILMGLCFILVFFLVKPDFGAIAKGMIPSIPKEKGALQLIAAMAGTTCSAAVFIIRSTVVAEKGWTIINLKDEKKDAFVSATTMLVLSGVIMAVSAGTLYIMGLSLDNTVDMIHLFEPLGGKFAAFILILGIVGAGLSTVFPIILIAPWLISDFAGKSRNIRSPLFRVLGSIALLFSFGLIFIEKTPPAMMILSQAFQAMILPAVAIPVLFLVINKRLMGENEANIYMKAGLYGVIIFSLITTYFAIVDLL
jgi:Mn2+/Fe2+ NRAMP family transporter